MKNIFTILSLLLSLQCFAQNPCYLEGRVTDSLTAEAVPFATIELLQNGVRVSTSTDFDGYYTLGPFDEGTYTLHFFALGYEEREVEEISLKSGQNTFDFKAVEPALIMETPISVISEPIIKLDDPTVSFTLTAEQIEIMDSLNNSMELSIPTDSTSTQQKDSD